MLLANLRWTLCIVVATLSVISILDWAEADWQADRAIRTQLAYVAPNFTGTLTMLQLAMALRMLEHQFGRIAAMTDMALHRTHLQHNHKSLVQQQQRENENNADKDGERVEQQQQLSRHSLTPLLLRGARRQQASTSVTWPQQQQQSHFKSVSDPAAYLNALRREHIRLTRIFNGVLTSFGLAVVGIVLTSILDLTLQAYLFYKLAVNLEHNSPLYLSYTVIWLMLVVGRLFSVVWMCDRVNGAVKKYDRPSHRTHISSTYLCSYILCSHTATRDCRRHVPDGLRCGRDSAGRRSHSG